MGFKGLYFVDTRRGERFFADANAGGSKKQAAFVTIQSLTTFPVASGVITIFWKVIQGVIDSPWTRNKLVPLAAAFVVGSFLTWWSISEPSTPPATTREKLGAAFVGIINIIFLAAAAIGIATTIDTGLSPTDQPAALWLF